MRAVNFDLSGNYEVYDFFLLHFQRFILHQMFEQNYLAIYGDGCKQNAMNKRWNIKVRFWMGISKPIE